MKYSKAVTLRSRDPTDIYYKRILDMMCDYNISLKEAISWDMDGYMPYPNKGIMLSPEEEVDFYLYVNYVPEGPRIFFAGVALGQFPDYTIGDEEETEQKDAGSSSKA
jgi:hypothetical protein